MEHGVREEGHQRITVRSNSEAIIGQRLGGGVRGFARVRKAHLQRTAILLDIPWPISNVVDQGQSPAIIRHTHVGHVGIIHMEAILCVRDSLAIVAREHAGRALGQGQAKLLLQQLLDAPAKITQLCVQHLQGLGLLSKRIDHRSAQANDLVITLVELDVATAWCGWAALAGVRVCPSVPELSCFHVHGLLEGPVGSSFNDANAPFLQPVHHNLRCFHAAVADQLDIMRGRVRRAAGRRAPTWRYRRDRAGSRIGAAVGEVVLSQHHPHSVPLDLLLTRHDMLSGLCGRRAGHRAGLAA
mmetsp:Transcript_814/g.2046  ORF Transcript_814/g.2046 Transcript_814/m.2046 type:complete len:299 (+) Transcript_814:221-1117(+)